MCACARVPCSRAWSHVPALHPLCLLPSLPPLSPNPPRAPLSLQLDDEQVQAILYSAANANRRCLAWSFRALSLSLFLSSFLCSLHLLLSLPPNLVVSDHGVAHETYIVQHRSSVARSGIHLALARLQVSLFPLTAALCVYSVTLVSFRLKSAVRAPGCACGPTQ